MTGRENEAEAGEIGDLLRAMDDRRQQTRAAQRLRHRGPAAIPGLLAILERHESAYVRSLAAESLRWLISEHRATAEAARALPVLLAVLGRDESQHVLSPVTFALGSFGPEAAAALPTLLEAAGRWSGWDPGAVGFALWAIGRRPEAIPTLIRALGDRGYEEELWEVVGTLGEIGPAARAAIPAIEAIMEQARATGNLWEGEERIFEEALERIRGGGEG